MSNPLRQDIAKTRLTYTGRHEPIRLGKDKTATFNQRHKEVLDFYGLELAKGTVFVIEDRVNGLSNLGVFRSKQLRQGVILAAALPAIAVAIDGFGAAYSSLVGLHRLPVNKLKIDRALVAEVSKQGKGIIAGIVGLAHALDLKVTAVGVETEAQREALKACGCDYLQGYLTGRPVDAETAAKDYV